jgi:hypothetical protein
MNTSLTSPSLLRDFYYPCACTTNSIKLASAGAIANCLRISVTSSLPCSRFVLALQMPRSRLAPTFARNRHHRDRRRRRGGVSGDASRPSSPPAAAGRRGSPRVVVIVVVVRRCFSVGRGEDDGDNGTGDTFVMTTTTATYNDYIQRHTTIKYLMRSTSYA